MRRRQFLTGSLAFATAAFARSDQKPASNFPNNAHDRLAVSTYPFRALIPTRDHSDPDAPKPTMSLEQFAASVPAKFEVNGIEPWGPHFQSVDPDYVHGLAEAFGKAGLRVVNVPVDVPINLCGPDGKNDAGIDQYKKWIDAAVILKSPSIRIHIPHQPGGKADLPCALSSLKTVAAYGAQKNIVVNLENDEPQTEDPFTVVDVIKTVNSPYLRALPDFCNSMLIGDDSSYNDRGLAAMFRYAYNISHVKDSESDQGRLYTVDVPHIFGIAKKAGYRGYFSMEFEGTGDPYPGTKKLIEQSLKALS